MNIWL